MLEELRAANARLAERVAALERAVGRNSGNSSMPPSTDDLPGRTKPVGRRVKGSGRSRGKQPGAPGSTLAWVREPDEQIAHRPQGTCGCGADLAGAAEVGIERSHQVHDLPEIRIQVRQHDLYRVRCGCGREHVADRVEAVSAAPASYGPAIGSLIVYLLIYQHVPVARCVELIADLTGGTGPSTGFAHGLLARCATAVRRTVTTIKSLITLAHVVGFDETTLRAGPAGAKRYVLSAVTKVAELWFAEVERAVDSGHRCTSVGGGVDDGTDPDPAGHLVAAGPHPGLHRAAAERRGRADSPTPPMVSACGSEAAVASGSAWSTTRSPSPTAATGACTSFSSFYRRMPFGQESDGA